jgi:uncharacterized protein YbjQ (UPF0145 family)
VLRIWATTHLDDVPPNDQPVIRADGAVLDRAVIVPTTSDVAGQRVVWTDGQRLGVIAFVPDVKEVSVSRGKIVGKYTYWSQAVEKMHRQVIDRMIGDATAIGVNAILSMRFDSTATLIS